MPCRLSCNILAHEVAWPDKLLPDPITQQLPKFQASDVEVCRLLPGLLRCSESHFIQEAVTLLTFLKGSGPSLASSSDSPSGGSSNS